MATKKLAGKQTPANIPPVADKPKTIQPHQVVLSSNTQNAAVIDACGKFAGKPERQAWGYAPRISGGVKALDRLYSHAQKKFPF